MDAKLQSQVLIESLPYLRKLHGETVVIKYGGHAMKDEALKAAFARNIALLKLVGIHPVVVREGGMSGDMGITLMFCLAGIAMVGFALYRLRFRQVRLTDRVEALKEQLED